MKYKIWLAISLILTIAVVITFWPDYKGNMFPLFTDITTVFLFLPAYFILLVGILPYIVTKIISNIRLRLVLNTLIFVGSFLYSLNFLEYSLGVKTFISFICSGLGFLYFMLSKIINKEI
ncbi:MAG: hypothetical protein A4E55_02112 [Pelotomaculum sp. PtaU1.Bin035]|nr:MAG: hypothetical protein A4E55_02112 [Pelotomaculum sp. PtaU1.Bin035]